MNIGDKVYGKCNGEWHTGEILSISKEVRGILWWKKAVEVALVQFNYKEWNNFNHDWHHYNPIKRIPMMRLKEASK